MSLHWTSVVDGLAERSIPEAAVPKILVVDDAKGERNLLTRLLQLEGYEVASVADGSAALAQIEEDPVDLLLLNVEMPQMDGPETLRRLKKDPRFRNIPVIMLSASSSLDRVVRCIELGAEDYLPQPFNRTLLQARIGASLKRKRLADREHALMGQLQAEISRSDMLLRNIFPDSVVQRLKGGQSFIADGYPEVSVMFADIVGFTSLASRMTPGAMVHSMNDIFSGFDRLAELHGAEKIKTIGDSYMAATGVPVERPGHAEAITKLALDMLESIVGMTIADYPLQLRIGIHSGPVVAGITGTRKFAYDIWGQTVNLASRMESQGLPGRVQITEATRRLLPAAVSSQARGMIEVKGIGPIQTHLLV